MLLNNIMNIYCSYSIKKQKFKGNENKSVYFEFKPYTQFKRDTLKNLIDDYLNKGTN